MVYYNKISTFEPNIAAVKMKKILITYKVYPKLVDSLRNEGFHVDYHPGISVEEATTIIGSYNGLIVGGASFIVGQEFLNHANTLEFIGRPGSGLDTIDLQACKNKNIKVINSPEGNRNAVAEHALGMLFCLLNNLRWADEEVRNKLWEREKNRGFELMGKTVGIIGFGNTGSQFAKKLSALGVQILAYDKYKQGYADEIDYVKECSLEEIWLKADIISFHLQHNKETHYYLNTDFIQRCKKDIIVINTSRGPIVETKALLKGLESGQVSGACLDVLENENPKTFNLKELEIHDKLFDLKQTVYSPHVAGWSDKSKIGMSMVLFDKIVELLNDTSQNTDL